jgi:hypothetical protein
MTKLFKVAVVQWWLKDAWTGPDGVPCDKEAPGAMLVKARKVPAGTPGARKVKKKSSKWYARLPGGKSVPLCTNKVAAGQMLLELVKKAELGELGIVDPFEKHRNRPLTQHLEDWRGVLLARGNTAEYVELKVSRARKVIDACGFVLVGDLSASGVETALANMRTADGTAKAPRCGAQTSNHYLGAVKQFARWLVKDRRTGENSLSHLEGGNVKLDRRHDRRELTDAELVYLFEHTQKEGRRDA